MRTIEEELHEAISMTIVCGNGESGKKFAIERIMKIFTKYSNKANDHTEGQLRESKTDTA